MKRHVMAAVGACALTGCALNAMRVETTKAFATASAETVAQTRTYMNDVAERRRIANAALAASDPSCVPVSSQTVPGRYAIYVRKLRASEMGRRGRVPLCLGSRETPTAANSVEILLNPLGPEKLAPKLLLLAAVADYGAALAKIAERGKPDVSKELGGIAAKLDDIGTLARVAGADVPGAASALDTDEGKALIGVLQMAAELAHEARQVADIRARVDRDGVTVDAGLDAIAREVKGLALIDRNSVDRRGAVQYEDYRRHRASWDFDRRSAAMLAIIRQEAELAASDAAAAKVTSAVTELKGAHGQLRVLLEPNPQLDAKTRERVRAIARERLWRALDLIAGAAGALAGV